MYQALANNEEPGEDVLPVAIFAHVGVAIIPSLVFSGHSEEGSVMTPDGPPVPGVIQAQRPTLLQEWQKGIHP